THPSTDPTLFRLPIFPLRLPKFGFLIESVIEEFEHRPRRLRQLSELVVKPKGRIIHNLRVSLTRHRRILSIWNKNRVPIELPVTSRLLRNRSVSLTDKSTDRLSVAIANYCASNRTAATR